MRSVPFFENRTAASVPAGDDNSCSLAYQLCNQLLSNAPGGTGDDCYF
nr:hypothetical protein [Glutamicibacter halophytocola]